VNDKPVVIFDFDGTIADSLLAMLNMLYSLAHHEALPKEDISELRGMGFPRMLLRLRIPPWLALWLLRQARLKLARDITSLELVSGIDTAIKTLAKANQLFVVSANNEPNIRAFLQRYELESYFTGVVGDANPFDKSRALRRLISECGLNPGRSWYVGDRIWDIRSARRAGLKSAAVSWGYSNIHVLKRGRPDALVFNADELVNAVQERRRGR